MRAVVDTNIWVSASINPAGAPAEVLAAYHARRFTLVTSEPMLSELRAVLNRPRIAKKYGIRSVDVETLIGAMRLRAELVPITGAIRICRDPGDDMVIETALLGHADVLVSRDEDLARAQEVTEYLSEKGVRTLTIRHFLKALG